MYVTVEVIPQQATADVISPVLVVNAQVAGSFQHNAMLGIQGGITDEYYHLSAAELAEFGVLVGGGDSTLHYHSADRDRANHTGTQLLATISDAGSMAAEDAADYLPLVGGTMTGTLLSTSSLTPFFAYGLNPIFRSYNSLHDTDGRVGTDSGGLFIVSDTVGKSLRLLTKSSGGSLVTRLSIGDDGNVLVSGFSASTVGLTVKGAAAQSANLQEWQDSSGAVLASTSGSHTYLNATGINTKGLTLGDSVRHSPSLRGNLEIINQSPGIYQEAVRTSGGVAFANFDLWLTNSTESSSTNIAQIGAFGDMGDDVTPPSLTYLYLSSILSPAFNNANMFLHVNGAVSVGIGNASSSSALNVRANSASDEALIVGGAVAQSANLQEWQDSSGGVLANVEANGDFHFTDTNARMYAPNFSFNKTGFNSSHNSIGMFGTALNSSFTIGLNNASNVTGGISFVTKNIERMSIDANGDIHLMASGGDKIGLHGAAPIVQPTITGSRGGNVALANLLTWLALRGDIIDGTAA